MKQYVLTVILFKRLRSNVFFSNGLTIITLRLAALYFYKNFREMRMNNPIKKHRKMGFPVSPRVSCARRGAVFPGAGKPSAGRFANSPFKSPLSKSKEHLFRCSFVAEKVGFEPTHRLPQSTPLAGEPLTATWVLLHIQFRFV